ncbi:MAG: hypothetical protein V9H25_13695 [Candidatus Competibacter sp.]
MKRECRLIPWRDGIRGRFALLAAIVGLTVTPMARADCDGCVVAAIHELKVEMIRQFAELKNHLSAEIKTLRQSGAQVEKDSLRARQDIGFMLPTGGCESATAAAAAGPARDRAEAYLRAFNHLRRPEKTGTAASKAMVETYLTDYCAPEDVGVRGCTQASARPNAPFLAETLLSGSGVGSAPDSTRPNSYLPEVLSFNPDRVLDARRFIDNLVDPYPLDDLPKDLQGTPQGMAFWMRKKVYEGQLSVARYTLNHALALRVPSTALRGWLERVWRESKADEHLAALRAQLPERISYAELLKTEVDRRYASPSWYAGIAGSPEAAVLRELAYMAALQINLTYLRFRQGERMELLLAEQVASGMDAHRRGPLLAELAAANRLVNPGSTGSIGVTGNSTSGTVTPPSSLSPAP